MVGPTERSRSYVTTGYVAALVIIAILGCVSHRAHATNSIAGPVLPTSGDASFTVATLMGPATSAPTVGASADAEILKYLANKEYDKALSEALKLIQADPGNAAGYNLQGAAYLGKGDVDNARKSFEKAQETQRDDSQALMNLAQLDLQQKDVASARKRYQAILAKNPTDAFAMLGMAKAENLAGNKSESLAWLNRAKAANRGTLPPILALALHYLYAGDYPKAMAELDEAQRYHPEQPEVLGLMGQAQLAAGDKAGAVSTYRKLVSVRPQSSIAHYRLGIAQMGTGDFAGADESLTKAVQLKPDYVEALDTLGALKVQAGDYAEALKLAQQVKKLVPKSPEGFALEGDAFMAQQRFALAQAAYERAAGLRETSVLSIKLHMAQAKAGKRPEADARLRTWLDAHPDDLRVRGYLAEQYLQASQDRLAMEQYQILTQKDPKNVVALNNLANLYQRARDPRALAAAEAAFKLDPRSPVVGDTLGWLLVENGNTARGIEILEGAIAKDPTNAEIHYHIAAAVAKSGDKARARKELEKLLAGERSFSQREAAQALLKQLL